MRRRLNAPDTSPGDGEVEPATAPGRSTRTARLARRAHGDSPSVSADAGAAVEHATNATGQPLPAPARATFERSLGTDLGGVRLHTGADSASAADALGARAYATGADIYFGAGQYAPESPFGMHLLAHEVAHTVQQRGDAAGPQAWRDISQPGDASEREADAAADAMVVGRPAAVTTGGAATVQRDTKPGAATSGAAWVVPFGEGTVTTKATAGTGVDRTYSQLEDLGEYLDTSLPTEEKALYDLTSYKSALVDAWKGVKGTGPLTKADAITLTTVGDQCEKGFYRIANLVIARVDASATKIKAQRVAEEDRLAEALHIAFLDGAVGSGKARLEDLKNVVREVSKLNSHLTKVLGWANKVPGAGVKTASEFFAKVTKPIDDKVQTVLSVADVLVDWANIGSANADALKAANAFRAGIKTIDVTMKFVKAVPLLGDLWSKYYAPALEASLVVARKLYLAEESQGRDVALLDWLQQAKKPGVTPKIGKGLDQYFPGGQPVLDVMYPIVNGGTAGMTPVAKKYFKSRTDWFDKGMGKGNGLADADSDHDVIAWLNWQSDVVWPALYGSLPKTLS